MAGLTLDEADLARVRDEIGRAIRSSGLSQRAWARERGIAHSYLREVLAAGKPPSDRILAAVGFRATVERIS